MTCSFAGSLLNDFIDQELPVNTKKSLEEHIEVCPACRAEYQELARLKGMLADNPVPEPRPEYWDEVRELILARTVEAETEVDLRPEIERRTIKWLAENLESIQVRLTAFKTLIISMSS